MDFIATQRAEINRLVKEQNVKIKQEMVTEMATASHEVGTPLESQLPDHSKSLRQLLGDQYNSAVKLLTEQYHAAVQCLDLQDKKRVSMKRKSFSTIESDPPKQAHLSGEESSERTSTDDTDEEDIKEIILSKMTDVGERSTTIDKKWTYFEIYMDLGVQVFCDLTTNGIILVVDTNMYLSCLGFLKDIMNLPGYSNLIIGLPVVVHQELDHMQHNKKGKDKRSRLLARNAAQAIRFIFKNLVAQNPRLCGQTEQEAKQAKQEIDDPSTNDDLILHSCKQFHEKCGNPPTILMTNDVCLLAKAVIEKVRTANEKTLLDVVKQLKAEGCS